MNFTTSIPRVTVTVRQDPPKDLKSWIRPQIKVERRDFDISKACPQCKGDYPVLDI